MATLRVVFVAAVLFSDSTRSQTLGTPMSMFKRTITDVFRVSWVIPGFEKKAWPWLDESQLIQL